MRYYLFIIFLICVNLFFVSWEHYPKDVMISLKLAGENKEELKQVLEHYRKKDKNKYKAACFLIANMPYHRTTQIFNIPSGYDKLFTQADSFYYSLFSGQNSQEILRHDMKDYEHVRFAFSKTLSNLPASVTEPGEPDIKWMTADFLINNIEMAFDVWRKSELLKNMDFDDFKELILPYRTHTEDPLSRSEIKNRYSAELEKEGYENIYIPVERYKAFFNKQRWLSSTSHPPKGHLGMGDLYIRHFKSNCLNLTTWSCNILRACGIPVFFDFTLQYRDRDRVHHFCASPDSTGIVRPYSVPDNNLMEDWENELKYTGKIYRRTYEANKNTPYFITQHLENIPKQLASPLIRDVTENYHPTVTLKFTIDEKVKNKVAYLCFLSEKSELKAVGWGKVGKNKKEIIFEQVPVHTLFVPAFYENGEYIPFADPFFLQTKDSANISQPFCKNKAQTLPILQIKDNTLKQQAKGITYRSIQANQNLTHSLIITRKYPEKREMKKVQKKIAEGIFLARNYENQNWDTVYKLLHPPGPYLQQIELNTNPNQKYRYYKFFVPGVQANISEMEFLGPLNASFSYEQPTPLPVFSPEEIPAIEEKTLNKYVGKPFATNNTPYFVTDNPISNLFDGNLETFCGDSSIEIDFDKPIWISHIRFAPRTANNMIIRGHRYQLLYWTKSGWQKSKIHIAEYEHLLFDNIPVGTVYWLRDLEYGNEELGFFYIDGKQHFIHEGLNDLTQL